MNEEQELYLEIGRNIHGAQESQMFGKPCFKINGKAFMSFYNGDLVCKMAGDSHKEALSLDGSKLFDPSDKGRPMKEWVQISFAHKNKWKQFAEEAAKYVESLQK
jgi:hypothetical protein